MDGKFDVYELGKVLWCMVAGRLKLVREWHRRREFDLTVKFPNDPSMHMVNAILDKCLTENPEECPSQASELLLWVDAHLSVMRRGGQMLREGTPRPCRVCGQGLYEPGGTRGQVVGLPSGSGPTSASWRHEGALYASLFVCNYCGNIQFFRTS